MPKFINKLSVFLFVIAICWLICIEVDRRHGNIRLKYYQYPGMILAPWNLLLDYASPPDTRCPFIPLEQFAGHELLEKNWLVIRDEALQSMGGAIATADFIRRTDGIVNDSTHWKTTPLFWYGKDFKENQANCPLTTKWLKSLPNVKAAMFSLIPAGKEILPHRGPYRGCIRYHLGLVIPKHRSHCYISVDGNKFL